MRAVGHGLQVIVIQFLKKFHSGEVIAAEKLEGLTVMQFGTGDFGDLDHPEPRELEMARLGLETAKDVLIDNRYDMVVLDEINLALHHRLIPLDDVMAMVKSRRPDVDLILTGRHAPPEIMELADTVSEITEIKHHQSKGHIARKGIEY
jgi:cob(I)alamin adenosyltransferase